MKEFIAVLLANLVVMLIIPLSMYRLFQSDTIDRDVFMCNILAYATMAIAIVHQKMPFQKTLLFLAGSNVGLAIMGILGFLLLRQFSDFSLQKDNIFFILFYSPIVLVTGILFFFILHKYRSVLQKKISNSQIE